MRKIFYILMFCSCTLFGQSVENLFDTANAAYKKGLYTEAIQMYDSIEKLGYVSSELYFNMANSYYKLNKVAPTIYNYEKALLLNPSNEDAKNNLVFAKRLTIDNIEELPKTIFDKLDESIVKKLNYDQWAILSVVFVFLGSIFFLVFYFSESPLRKRFFFITSILSFLILLITLSFTMKEFDESKSRKEAIIFAEEIEIKNAPTNNSDEVFMLHEGTKVLVLDTVDDWKKIKIADGKIGWIKQDYIKVLN